MNYARIINGVAVDVSINPSEQFHPTIAAEFVEVPDTVQPGWRIVAGVWAAPDDAAVVSTAAGPKVSPIEFKLLFTSVERVAIKAARLTDAIIDDFYDIVEDPRLTHVDLGLQSTQAALAYLQQQGLISAGRKNEILTGTVQ